MVTRKVSPDLEWKIALIGHPKIALIGHPKIALDGPFPLKQPLENP
jgi:hypothetical protein